MRAARAFYAMPPRAASRDASDSRLWSLWIHRRRRGVIGRIEPVAAPFVDVFAEIVNAVSVRLPLSNASRSCPLTLKTLDQLGRLVAPRIFPSVLSATTGLLPFCLGRQPVKLVALFRVP